MSLLKYSLLILAFISLAQAQSFNSKQCLDSDFNIEIKNNGQFFGLVKNNLKIEKKSCEITVIFKKILETKWEIDICREPIHIKVTSKGSQKVYKKQGECPQGGEYCKQKDSLLGRIQDYGLIYAEGERELLTTPHGQTYCTFLLLKKYLNENTLFSKYQIPANIFEEKMEKTETCPVPDVSPLIPEANTKSETSTEIETPKKSISAEGEF